MSIRARLLWLVVVATLVPAVLVGLRFFDDRRLEIDAATVNLSATAALLANGLDERVQSTQQLLYGLARARDLERPDREACSAFLATVREAYSQYTGILTVEPDGTLFCDSLRSNQQLRLSDRPYFQRALAATDGLALQPAFGRLTGTAVLQVAFAARPEPTRLAFVLLASLSLQDFALDHLHLMRPGMEMVLVDGDGTVLVRNPRRDGSETPIGGSLTQRPVFRMAVQGTGAEAAPRPSPVVARLPQRGPDGGARVLGEFTGADGRARIWATATSRHVQAAGMYILVSQSRAALVADANRRLAEDLAILALVSLLLFTGVWLFGEIGIRREVGRIGNMASRLGQGDLSARIPPPLPAGELGGLMSVLNRTAESLQQQHGAIADLNKKLLRSQRMEAVGQLTGGLAHDFNNLLTVILGSAELLEEQLAHDQDALDLAEAIRLAAERGGELTRSLLAFARRQPLEPRQTDVGQKIRGIEVLLRRTLGDAVECRLRLQPELFPALVDPAQLEAALMNLVLNARDAMPRGGLLTIETAATHVGDDFSPTNEELTPGDYVVVAVSDTGTGMTPEVLSQVFEPFFTTKEFGKGSGLGLSMVYGFVRQSRGHVRIYSEPDRGTTVKLFLPRATEADAVPAAVAAAPARGGTETVLVVEDDEMVRAHVVKELRHLGYRVLTAQSGVAALDVLRGDTRIDVLFTDVVMPGGLSGPELAEEARAMQPRIRVLYTSGYTENALLHNGPLDEGVTLLSKPYRRVELAEKLRKVLA